MLLHPSGMPDRIARLSILATAGLLLTYACGVYTVGTMVVYSCMIPMYAHTLRAARALLKTRLLIQFIGIPVTVAVLFALRAILKEPEWLRLTLGVVICVPLLLTINYKFKLGFSEISQVVTVSILTGSFVNNRTYFLTRLFFTTFGILISYFAYAYIFPLRHDREYETQRKMLFETLELLAQDMFSTFALGQQGIQKLERCVTTYAEMKKHLAVLRDDLDIRRQYKDYRGRIGLLVWESEWVGAFLDLAGMLTKHRVDEKYSESCRSYIDRETYILWKHLRSKLYESHPYFNMTQEWTREHIDCVRSDVDLKIVNSFVSFKSKLFVAG